MKDERMEHGVVDKSFLEQQICESANYMYTSKRTCPIVQVQLKRTAKALTNL